jgi:hypothetical protein
MTSLPRGMSERRTDSRPASKSMSSHFRPKDLAAAHAGHRQQPPEGVEAVVAGRLEEGPDLGGIPRLHLAAAGA